MIQKKLVQGVNPVDR